MSFGKLSPFHKKLLLAISISFMTFMSISMILYAHPNILEFIAALSLKVLAFMKLKLPALLIGLLVSLKNFMLGLTFIKVVILGVKRYIIDNIISKNIQEHFFVHLKVPLKKWWQGFDVKKKMLFFIPAAVFSVVGIYLAGVGKLLNFLGIKTIVIGFFKGLWIVGGKIIFFFTSYIWTAWFTPILEIFIFSWILSLLEKIPALKKFFDWIYGLISTAFSKFGGFLDKVINEPIQKVLRGAGRRLALSIHKRHRKNRLRNKMSNKTIEGE